MAALVLLELSGAFDVIDNKILQTRLEHSFGVPSPGSNVILVTDISVLP